MGVTPMSRSDAGSNETRERLLRAVNNWIRIQEDSINGEGPVEFLCECGADECSLTLQLAPEEYDEVAARPTRLLLAAEHRGPQDGHHVVSERDSYVVLEPDG